MVKQAAQRSDTPAPGKGAPPPPPIAEQVLVSFDDLDEAQKLAQEELAQEAASAIRCLKAKAAPQANGAAPPKTAAAPARIAAPLARIAAPGRIAAAPAKIAAVPAKIAAVLVKIAAAPAKSAASPAKIAAALPRPPGLYQMPARPSAADRGKAPPPAGTNARDTLRSTGKAAPEFKAPPPPWSAESAMPQTKVDKGR